MDREVLRERDELLAWVEDPDRRDKCPVCQVAHAQGACVGHLALLDRAVLEQELVDAEMRQTSAVLAPERTQPHA